jgi:hypothetical protein
MFKKFCKVCASVLQKRKTFSTFNRQGVKGFFLYFLFALKLLFIMNLICFIFFNLQENLNPTSNSDNEDKYVRSYILLSRTFPSFLDV